MPATMSPNALFGGGPSYVNSPPGTAKETVPKGPASMSSNLPVLPGVAHSLGMSLPMLIALGVLAWFLFRTF